ncbi:amphi-Trp domain-containing protein [Kribbia dieselivorans]|uniref:amphi-Trp domain-containing protein n=1 Tax=Kribbia dieselivorans TaxID=331526 RepID=UPI0008395761|nr:amphi-Trp domain-containing protein [Kribbia dieselivorans]
MKSSFKSTTVRSRAEAAELLRAVADALESDGSVELELNGSEIEFEVPAEVECEVEVELDAAGRSELEVELKWLAPGVRADDLVAKDKAVLDDDFESVGDDEAMHDADALWAEAESVALEGEEPVLAATEDVDFTLVRAGVVGPATGMSWERGNAGKSDAEQDDEVALTSATIAATTPAEFPHGPAAQS